MQLSRPWTRILWLLLLTAILSTCAPPEPEAEEVPAEPPPPARIVAIGDLHGDLEATRRALLMAGAIDVANRWVGGELILVQTGDILDRGDDEAAILSLFEDLKVQAEAAGGAVHLLNGNHELMNAYLDFRYVTDTAFDAFGAGVEPDPLDSLLATLDPRERNRAAAFRPGGPVAQELARRPTGLVVGTSLFVHGGILPEHAEMGLEEMNHSIQAWLRDEGPQPEWIRGDRSPVWTRLYSDRPTLAACDTLTWVLDTLGVQRMVVGHTVQPTGITAYCGGRVWCVDVGMAEHYGGRPEVLEIRGDVVRSIR
jgi:hypothetical protein